MKHSIRINERNYNILQANNGDLITSLILGTLFLFGGFAAIIIGLFICEANCPQIITIGILSFVVSLMLYRFVYKDICLVRLRKKLINSGIDENSQIRPSYRI